MAPIEVDYTSNYAAEDAKREHHTDLYDLVNVEQPTVILRRGANFHIFIKFKREFDAKQDAVRITFTFGPTPSASRGTKAVALVRPPKQEPFPKDVNHWEAERSPDDRDKKGIIVKIHIPPTVPVGIWHLSIETNIYKHRENTISYKIPNDIYILFNPWNPDDSVYLYNEEERNEYVLNETGKIWIGTFRNPRGKHWIFGQFEDIVLPAAVRLLEKSNLKHAKRANPVLVSRAISAIINSDDDDGLLEGRWDGIYSDGTSPHAWTGSVAILDEYFHLEEKPVKYGQCWVYSAVTVTVCRALGIPCRSTTNYVSGHDIDNPIIGRYIENLGNTIKNNPGEHNNDSLWSFHAWNDVWMTRPDLPDGYGGWQIIDSTPLSQSDRLKRCGPASVAAVKEGNIGLLYDTPLVFSEVNADIVHFIQGEEGYQKIAANKYRAGKLIVTKALGATDDYGDSDILDVTLVYKNKQGSEEEAKALTKVIGTPANIIEPPKLLENDVFFDLIDIESVPLGTGFDVVVKVRNDGKAIRTVSAFLSASSVFYTGKVYKDIRRSQGKFITRPGKEETLRLHVTPEDYLPNLVDHGVIKLLAFANVEETKQAWSEEDDFILTKPELTIVIVPGLLKLGEQGEVTFRFHNPLNEPLTDCVYTVEGPGRRKPRSVRFRDIQPKELVDITESFIANRRGDRKIIVNFASRQIPDISASSVVKVR